jgi:hypothetical protein
MHFVERHVDKGPLPLADGVAPPIAAVREVRQHSPTPQLPAGDLGAFGERGEFDPDHAGMHLAGRREAGEAAIGAGDDILAADDPRETADPFGDQFFMLDDVRGVGDDAGDQHLALGQLHMLPDAPFVLVARIGRLKGIGAGIDAEQRLDDVL